MATRIWTGEVSQVWNVDGNWSPSGEPVATDIAIIPATATVDIDGSDETGEGKRFDQLIIERGCSIAIGSAATKLQLDFTGETNATAIIGGTGAIYMELTEAKSILVNEAGGEPGTGQYSTNITTDTATNTSPITVNAGVGGSVSIAANAGETAKADEIRIASGSAVIGSGATNKAAGTTSVVITGGTVRCAAAINALTATGGTLRQEAAIAAAAVSGGTVYYNTAATLAEATVSDGGVLDFDEDPRAKTCTACKIETGGVIRDTHGVVTWTGGIAPQEGMTILAQ